MIKLSKLEEPEVLIRNSAKWTNAILVRMANGQKPSDSEKSKYNHRDIKEALVKETCGKCAYCESKIRHISYGDIEHVIPKSDRPEKWFCWDNLTLACDICNTNKTDRPVNDDVFVDPYAQDPEQFFWFLGAMLYPCPGSEAAAMTERLLELNRGDLLERRGERLTGLMKQLDVVQRCQSNALRDIYWEDFKKEAMADKEYAALSRMVLRMAATKLSLTE